MELIERFRLGYANRTLACRLAPKQYKAGAVLRSALQRIGILGESGHEHLNGSIVVPLFHVDTAAEGAPRHVAGAYGRKLLDNLRAVNDATRFSSARSGLFRVLIDVDDHFALAIAGATVFQRLSGFR